MDHREKLTKLLARMLRTSTLDAEKIANNVPDENISEAEQMIWQAQLAMYMLMATLSVGIIVFLFVHIKIGLTICGVGVVSGFRCRKKYKTVMEYIKPYRAADAAT